MKFENNFLITDSPLDLTNFGNYLGGLDRISLEDEIRDAKKNVLIRADIPLRESILQSVAKKEENFVYKVKNSTKLNDAVAVKVFNEVERVLSLKELEFAGFLVKNSNIDLLRIVKTAFSNQSIRNTFILWMYEQRPIIKHLLDVAITCVGLYIEIHQETYEMVDLVNLFRAGLMHDFAISEANVWEDDDTFSSADKDDITHPKESVRKLATFNLEQGSLESIEQSHILKNQYLSDGKSTTIENISAALLNMVEFFCFQKRTITEGDGTKPDLGKIMYQISYSAQKGFFPLKIVRVFEKFFDQYKSYFGYGQKVAQIEQGCINGAQASAYPKPKSTQVVCLNQTIDCVHRIHQHPIKIIDIENEVYSRFSTPILPGWYSKCEFTDDLPLPLEKI